MPATLEELLQQRACLRFELLRNATAVRAAQAQGKARRARPKSVKPQWTLTTPLRRLVLHMYVQAGYEPGPAADYVEALASRKKWRTCARDDIGRFIKDDFLRATDEEIAGVVMPEGTGYVCAAVRAQKILLERRLVHWVQRANRQQGVAPTTSMVLDAAEAQRMADPRADELRPHGAAHEGRARMWAWRWRRRWGGRFGVIPSREPLTMPDMRSKVQPWGRTPAQFWSELGP